MSYVVFSKQGLKFLLRCLLGGYNSLYLCLSMSATIYYIYVYNIYVYIYRGFRISDLL